MQAATYGARDQAAAADVEPARLLARHRKVQEPIGNGAAPRRARRAPVQTSSSEKLAGRRHPSRRRSPKSHDPPLSLERAEVEAKIGAALMLQGALGGVLEPADGVLAHSAARA